MCRCMDGIQREPVQCTLRLQAIPVERGWGSSGGAGWGGRCAVLHARVRWPAGQGLAMPSHQLLLLKLPSRWTTGFSSASVRPASASCPQQRLL